MLWGHSLTGVLFHPGHKGNAGVYLDIDDDDGYDYDDGMLDACLVLSINNSINLAHCTLRCYAVMSFEILFPFRTLGL